DESSSFFFQAEDGIRDATVTGVQTCALPICHLAIVDHVVAEEPDLDRESHVLGRAARVREAQVHGHREPAGAREEYEGRGAAREIGRASCRERGWRAGLGGARTEDGRRGPQV